MDFVEFGFDDFGIIKNEEINWEVFKNFKGIGVEFIFYVFIVDGKNFLIDFGVYGKELVKRMGKVIRIVNYFGIEVIVVYGGDIGKSYMKVYVNILRYLRKFKLIVEDYGVKFVVENFFEG